MKTPIYLTHEKDIATYKPNQELIDVFEMSHSLARPLLLSGKPGTGKTQFAHWLSNEYLNNKTDLPFKFRTKPFIFNTKSTSIHTDLFYTYDAVAHFRNKDESKTTGDFIQLNALGLAILHAKEFKNIPSVYDSIVKRSIDIKNTQEKHHGSVILIDEVDKAPRDFPNDLLFEIENLSFAIKEISNEFIALSDDEKQRLIVILTSNSEKNLPDAFLRRCAYYHIEFPDKHTLRNIVISKMNVRNSNQLNAADTNIIAKLDQLLDFFMALHNAPEIMKKPSTSECIEWINYLHQHGILSIQLNSPAFRTSLAALVKNVSDRDHALEMIKKFTS